MADIVERLRGLTYEEEWLEEAAAEIERLREALQRVADHRPGTPGLHYDSLEQLIDSATGIAKLALGDEHNVTENEK